MKYSTCEMFLYLYLPLTALLGSSRPFPDPSAYPPGTPYYQSFPTPYYGQGFPGQGQVSNGNQPRGSRSIHGGGSNLGRPLIPGHPSRVNAMNMSPPMDCKGPPAGTTPPMPSALSLAGSTMSMSNSQQISDNKASATEKVIDVTTVAPRGSGGPTGSGAPTGSGGPTGSGATTGSGAPIGPVAPTGSGATTGSGAPIGSGAPTGPVAPPVPMTPQSAQEFSAPLFQLNPGGGSLKHNGGYAQSFNQFIPILSLNHVINPTLGQYDIEFVTGGGIHQQESGYMKPLNTGKGPYGSDYSAGLSNVKTGSVYWTSPEGIPVSFSYIADEHGYRAYGSHIPISAPEPQISGPRDSYSNPTNYNSGNGMTPYESLAPNY